MVFTYSTPEVVPGAVFGHLTALYKVEGYPKRWVCRCKCGDTITAYRTELLRKKKVSCGCIKNKTLEINTDISKTRSKKFVDLAGQTFGYLTAIEFVGLNNVKSSVWKFRCVCGNEVVRTGSQVKNGAIRSCGCKKSELIVKKCTKFTPEEYIFRHAYRVHVRSAAKRGYVNNLTEEQYISISKQPCHYCGSMSVRMYMDRTPVPSNSVDRLNSESHYSLGNSVAACFECQRSKSALTETGFLNLVKKVAMYRKLIS